MMLALPPMMPQQSPAQTAGQHPGTPPSGMSPATGPTQNRGYEVAAQKMVGLALLILESALPMAGAGTPMGNEVHKAIGGLAKHVPPGTVTPQDIQSQMQKMMLKQQQAGAQMAQMKMAQQQQGAVGGAPMPPSGGAPMVKAA